MNVDQHAAQTPRCTVTSTVHHRAVEELVCSPGVMRAGEGVGWRLRAPLTVLAITVLTGTIAYVVLEGWAWDDALYMVVTTISTVGFGEVHPLSRAGRLFTMVLIVVGVG